jgi:two-component system NarL family response regulator
MDENSLIRILVADDHAIVRDGLCDLLNWRSQMEVVAQASNGLEAVELFRRFQPDITLMDMRMPHMDGLTAIKTILAEFPEARIIVLTSFDGPQNASLLAGAKAFVLKEASRQELLDTIRNVHCAPSPGSVGGRDRDEPAAAMSCGSHSVGETSHCER